MARADAAVKVRSLVILWSRWGFCCLILFILAIAIAESSRSARQNCKNGVRGRERVEPGRREDMGRLGQHVVLCVLFFFL